MSRRQQLKTIVPTILDIYGDDHGASIVALLDMVAYVLDENDDLIGGHLTIEAADIIDPNLDYHMPDTG